MSQRVKADFLYPRVRLTESQPRVGEEGLCGLPERGVRHVLHIIQYWNQSGPGLSNSKQDVIDDERTGMKGCAVMDALWNAVCEMSGPTARSRRKGDAKNCKEMQRKSSQGPFFLRRTLHAQAYRASYIQNISHFTFRE